MVFTQGLDLRPFSTAFFASSAAPIITDGFEVLVQEVIEAITTSPFLIVVAVAPTFISIGVALDLSLKYPGNDLASAALESLSEMRSCGRLGPAIEGTTVDRSNSICSEKRGSIAGSCHKPCFLA